MESKFKNSKARKASAFVDNADIKKLTQSTKNIEYIPLGNNITTSKCLILKNIDLNDQVLLKCEQNLCLVNIKNNSFEGFLEIKNLSSKGVYYKIDIKLNQDLSRINKSNITIHPKNKVIRPKEKQYVNISIDIPELNEINLFENLLTIEYFETKINNLLENEKVFSQSRLYDIYSYDEIISSNSKTKELKADELLESFMNYSKNNSRIKYVDYHSVELSQSIICQLKIFKISLIKNSNLKTYFLKSFYQSKQIVAEPIANRFITIYENDSNVIINKRHKNLKTRLEYLNKEKVNLDIKNNTKAEELKEIKNTIKKSIFLYNSVDSLNNDNIEKYKFTPSRLNYVFFFFGVGFLIAKIISFLL